MIELKGENRADLTLKEGTVNGKYLSVAFVGDDAFDMDQGYQGKLQHLFAILGQDESGRGFEIDNSGSNMDVQPRTYPTISNVILIGPQGGEPGGDGSDQLMRLREGTGGEFVTSSPMVLMGWV